MSARDDGGPAFPIAAPAMDSRGIPFNHIQGGMSLRDYFAAKAMQGIMASPTMYAGGARGLALTAYEMADAMLVQRGKVQL